MTFTSPAVLTSIAAVLAAFLVVVPAARAGSKPHLFIEVLNAYNVRNTDTFGKPDPYIRIKVQDRYRKIPEGCWEGKWPIRDATQYPYWYSTKMICNEFPQDETLDLKITLRDDDVIGYSNSIRSDQEFIVYNFPKLVNRTVVWEPHPNKYPNPENVIRIRIKKYFPAELTKRVYLVRHAAAMPASDYPRREKKEYSDRGITRQGLAQAQELAVKVKSVLDGDGSDYEQTFGHSTLAVSTPHRHTVETALVALDPMVQKGVLAEPLRVKPDAVWSLGEKNDYPSGKHLGDDLAKAVRDDLKQRLYTEDPVPKSINDAAEAINAEEIAGRWWNDNSDDNKGSDHRSKIHSLFVEQLFWFDDRDIVVVGQARFIREVLRLQMQSGLKANIDKCASAKDCMKWGRYTASQLTSRYLEHGGVVALDLDFSGQVAKMEGGGDGVETSIIKDVQFLFGSKLEEV